MRLGINACRARSGGAIAHLRGMVGQLDPERHCFEAIHVWSHDALLDRLPDRPWLVRHSTGTWQRSVARELYWERFRLKRLAREASIDLMFNVDAGSICRFRPAVTMSQDMLSFEPGEMERYPFGRARARLLALRFVQLSSLRRADGAIFLTEYAARRIQLLSGKLANSAVIPHGIDESFQRQRTTASWPRSGERAVRCVYVSNTAPYKHQWHVVDAVARLRAAGQPVELHLVGGGTGPARARLDAQLAKSDPDRRFVTLREFVPHPEIPELLAEADLFLFASSCENMPITLLEAMAVGLPIACSDRGPMPEVLGDGGIYFDPEDASSIAAAVDLLLRDSARRSGYARRAKALAAQYSWARCADETCRFIAETFERSQWGATAT